MDARRRNYRKLGVSVESVEVFTTSMESTINMHEKLMSMKKIILRFVKRAQMV